MWRCREVEQGAWLNSIGPAKRSTSEDEPQALDRRPVSLDSSPSRKMNAEQTDATRPVFALILDCMNYSVRLIPGAWQHNASGALESRPAPFSSTQRLYPASYSFSLGGCVSLLLLEESFNVLNKANVGFKKWLARKEKKVKKKQK